MDQFKSHYMEVYENLFSDEEGSLQAKADAFDQIAACYYDCNFGTMPKAEIDLLMFSLFLEQAMTKSKQDYYQFDDYALSKQFGITQTRLASLRERKALKYPSQTMDWMKRLEQLSQNVRLDNGFILLTIPERDIFLEIQHIIEVNGGYLDIGHNPKLLKIELKDYLDLMLMLDPEKTDSNQVWERLEAYAQENSLKLEFSEKVTFGEALKKAAPAMIIELIGACVPVVGKPLEIIMSNVYNKLKG